MLCQVILKSFGKWIISLQDDVALGFYGELGAENPSIALQNNLVDIVNQYLFDGQGKSSIFMTGGTTHCHSYADLSGVGEGQSLENWYRQLLGFEER